MGQRIFAIGDIHGCFIPFRQMIESEIKFQQDDFLVLLGDYIDRGPDSKKVIDYIIDLKVQNYNVIPLAGNHEIMLLDTHRNEKHLISWLYNGAGETLRSFGLQSIKMLEKKYLSFFSNLKYYHSSGNFLFVHAGFDDTAYDPFMDMHTMIWLCRDTYSNPLLKDKIIIHGHCPRPVKVLEEIVKSGRQVIGIDTGCVFNGLPGYGKLTAIELNTMQLYIV
jgi:serine/threonine protein phosphatase 1